MTDPLGIQFHGGDEESGHVFAVETVAQAGYLLESHKHEHSHMSVLVSGTYTKLVGRFAPSPPNNRTICRKALMAASVNRPSLSTHGTRAGNSG